MAHSPAETQSRREAAPWPKVRLGEIYDIPSSNGLSRPSAVRGEGYRMINMGELFAHDIISDIEMERVKMSDKEKAKFLVKEGDLLFARQSLVAAGAGKCSIIKNVNEPTTFESHLIRVRLNGDNADSLFYYYYFRLPNTPIKGIVNQCAQAGIRGRDLEKIQVPLPPLAIQHAIAKRLSAYDNLIENNTRRIAILERKAEQLYKEWFVRRRLSRHATAPSAALSLGDIIEVSRGLSYTSSEIDTDAGVQLINLKNIQPYGGFRYDGSKRFDGKYKPDQIVVHGDLVMGVTDMTQDRRAVGSVALMPPLKETSVISADLIKIEPKIDKLFLYAMFRYGGLSRYISQFANGANVLHLRPQSIMGIKVQVPSEEAMERLSTRLRPMIALMDNLNEQNALLSRQRDLLLPRLMSGRVKL